MNACWVSHHFGMVSLWGGSVVRIPGAKLTVHLGRYTCFSLTKSNMPLISYSCTYYMVAMLKKNGISLHPWHACFDLTSC